MNYSIKDFKICIIGLGYVGLPLAHRLGMKGFDVFGYDIDIDRVNELKRFTDRNNDILDSQLKDLSKKIFLTHNEDDIKNCNIYIVTVPTPINDDKTPNLNPLINASKLVGKLIKKNDIVVYESTVYPGVTDEICTPVLENESGLDFNSDFSTGYSPERIVPGDKVNTIEKITKIVSASNEKALEILYFIYSSIIEAGIHKAKSIKVAEAAKVTENIQRDVNLALINELHQIYTALGINSNEVIEAAGTKWNFMKLTPGLVGGHCISVDPYYLMHKSMMTGYTPNLMRSAREINDGMSQWIVNIFLRFAQKRKLDLNKIHVTFLGYTFKENCNDTRNTKVKDLILTIKNIGISVSLWDPLVDEADLLDLKKHDIKIHKSKPKNIEFIFLCVYHDEILEFIKEVNCPVFDFRKIEIN